MQANKEKITRLLKTAKGQLDGLLNMVEEDAYCMDVSNQILACVGILKRVNSEILKCHIQGCVKNALANGLNNSDKYIDELIAFFEKFD